MNKARRAERLRRAPKTVMGYDVSELTASRHAFQRFWIASRFQASTASARFVADIAFATGTSR